MKVSRFAWDGTDPRGLAQQLRALQPPLAQVSEAVAEIIAAVEAEGDAAVLRYEAEFGAAPASLRVPDSEQAAYEDAVEPSLAAALRAAARNLVTASRIAGATPERGAEMNPELPPEAEQDACWSGRMNDVTMTGRDVPVRAAGAYAPGGLGAYPSTVVMCCVPARLAGVDRVAVASPPRADGLINPAVAAAARIAGAHDLYVTGGAQAIAALALGTESIEPVDVIVGPGNRYVTEAKRQLVGRVGIDGIAGPSELMVIADGSAQPRLVALDLCAQGEHGDDGLLVACAIGGGSEAEALLGEIEAQTTALAAKRDSVKDAPLVLLMAPSPQAAVELANALAPEHLELACEDADELSQDVLYAGCVFVGREGATAFGDYAAGSNHVLPTGGAGRFQGPLGPGTFRRSITRVRIGPQGARELAPVVATLAEAEGFPVHGESATARVEDEGRK